MTWSAPSAFAFSILASSPTVVITVQPIAFAILIAAVPMPEPPACTRMVSPGWSLALSNSMCSTVANAIGAQAASRIAVDEIARKSVDMETKDALHVLAEIIAALAAGLAGAAGERAIHHHRIARHESGHAGANRGDLARRLDADHHRELALGERHAAPAPQVEVVEPDRLDAHLHLARLRRRRRRRIDKLDLAVGNEGERTHLG